MIILSWFHSLAIAGRLVTDYQASDLGFVKTLMNVQKL